MHSSALVIIFTLFLSSAQAVNLIIAAVGASITYGVKSSHGNGYRDDLVYALEAAGHKVHMVGTQKAGDFKWGMNEGYPGYKISEVQSKFNANFANFRIDDGTKQKPNVIVTLVGTNDNDPNRQGVTPESINGAPERFNTLLDNYQKACPDCVIIASSLPPNRNQAWNTNIVNYNNAIKKIVEKRNAAGQHILFSDGNSGITVAQNMSDDGIHPNDSGYVIIGKRMAQQVEKAVARGWTKTPAKFK